MNKCSLSTAKCFRGPEKGYRLVGMALLNTCKWWIPAEPFSGTPASSSCQLDLTSISNLAHPKLNFQPYSPKPTPVQSSSSWVMAAILLIVQATNLGIILVTFHMACLSHAISDLWGISTDTTFSRYPESDSSSTSTILVQATIVFHLDY